MSIVLRYHRREMFTGTKLGSWRSLEERGERERKGILKIASKKGFAVPSMLHVGSVFGAKTVLDGTLWWQRVM